MCGNVGMAGNIGVQEIKAFREMLLYNSCRGFDSTGVATIGVGQTPVLTHKELGGPTNLFNDKSPIFSDDGIVRGWPRIIMGHGRSATRGYITKENAHPFTVEHITGMHNGTLWDWKDLDGWSKDGSDSEALITTISTRGPDACWSLFMGDAAVVYWDNKEKTLNFIRNKGRPLWLLTNKKKDVLFWASEPWMVHIAAQRNRIEIGEAKADVFEIEVDKLYSYTTTMTTYTQEGVRELAKKTFYPALSGISGGMKTNPRFIKGAGTTSDRQTNTNWADGTDRLGKETRGIEFRLTSRGTTGVFSGVTMVGNHHMLIYPDNNESEAVLLQWLMDKKVLVTKARVRVANSVSNGALRISSANVGELVPPQSYLSLYEKGVAKAKTFVPMILKNPTPTLNLVDPLYRGFNNQHYTRAGWMGMLKSFDIKGCMWCSDGLDIDESKGFRWLSRKDCLCEICSKDKEILTTIGGMYPNMHFPV